MAHVVWRVNLLWIELPFFCFDTLSLVSLSKPQWLNGVSSYCVGVGGFFDCRRKFSFFLYSFSIENGSIKMINKGPYIRKGDFSANVLVKFYYFKMKLFDLVYFEFWVSLFLPDCNTCAKRCGNVKNAVNWIARKWTSRRPKWVRVNV